MKRSRRECLPPTLRLETARPSSTFRVARIEQLLYKHSVVVFPNRADLTTAGQHKLTQRFDPNVSFPPLEGRETRTYSLSLSPPTPGDRVRPRQSWKARQQEYPPPRPAQHCGDARAADRERLDRRPRRPARSRVADSTEAPVAPDVPQDQDPGRRLGQGVHEVLPLAHGRGLVRARPAQSHDLVCQDCASRQDERREVRRRHGGRARSSPRWYRM